MSEVEFMKALALVDALIEDDDLRNASLVLEALAVLIDLVE